MKAKTNTQTYQEPVLVIEDDRMTLKVTGDYETLEAMYDEYKKAVPRSRKRAARQAIAAVPKRGIAKLTEAIRWELKTRTLIAEMRRYDRTHGTHYGIEAMRQTERERDMRKARELNAKLAEHPYLKHIHYDPTRNYRDHAGEWGVLSKRV